MSENFVYGFPSGSNALNLILNFFHVFNFVVVNFTTAYCSKIYSFLVYVSPYLLNFDTIIICGKKIYQSHKKTNPLEILRSPGKKASLLIPRQVYTELHREVLLLRILPTRMYQPSGKKENKTILYRLSKGFVVIVVSKIIYHKLEPV